MKKVFRFLRITSNSILLSKSPYVFTAATIIVAMTVTNLGNVSCTSSDSNSHAGYYREGEGPYSGYYTAAGQQFTDYNYFTPPTNNGYSFYTHQSQVSKRTGISSNPGSSTYPFDSYPQQFQVSKRQENAPEANKEEGPKEAPKENQEQQKPPKEEKKKRPDNQDATADAVHHSHDFDQPPNSFDQAIQKLREPTTLIPIINNLVVIALFILHLPVIIPTVLIPLAFFCVGAILIPIVRVNYFINHRDDGEDGRRSLMSSWISNLIDNL